MRTGSIEQVASYSTSDGELFKDKLRAERHQREVSLKALFAHRDKSNLIYDMAEYPSKYRGKLASILKPPNPDKS